MSYTPALLDGKWSPPLMMPATIPGTGYQAREVCNMKSLNLQKNRIAYVAVKGRLGEPINPEFPKTIREILKSDTRRLLLDLSSLEYLRSSDNPVPLYPFNCHF
jgi:hypothetical protein